jgi:hypothetical protein
MRSTTPMVSSLYRAGENRAGSESCMAGGVGGSTTLYSAPKSNQFLPTRSRQRKEPILLTCGGENGSQRANGDGVVRPDFNSGESSFRRCSGSKNYSGDNGAGNDSSKQRIGARGSGEAVQRRRAAMERRLSLGSKRLGRTSIYRGFQSPRNHGGLWSNPSLNQFKTMKFGDKINWG